MSPSVCYYQSAGARPSGAAGRTPHHQVMLHMLKEAGLELRGREGGRTISHSQRAASHSLTLTVVLLSVAMQLPVRVFIWQLSAQCENRSFCVRKAAF